ncbi:hypothetical protein [Nakamurella sp.]|uniref:hypothetical protein n=1 Tax=Nakamurella sp. TaxID=1869182 RepID=UPI003B3AE31A
MAGSVGFNGLIRSGVVAGGLLFAPAFDGGAGESRPSGPAAGAVSVGAVGTGAPIAAPVAGPVEVGAGVVVPVRDLVRPLCGFCVE